VDVGVEGVAGDSLARVWRGGVAEVTQFSLVACMAERLFSVGSEVCRSDGCEDTAAADSVANVGVIDVVEALMEVLGGC
jgi:hypothetical protein